MIVIDRATFMDIAVSMVIGIVVSSGTTPEAGRIALIVWLVGCAICRTLERGR